MKDVLILVSSSMASDRRPGRIAYAAPKGALLSLTLPLTQDLAKYAIGVVAIAPSIFDSSMTFGMSAKVEDSFKRR